MFVPDKVSLSDMLAEVKKRVTVKKHDFFLTEVVIPHAGHCLCVPCVVQRAELHQQLNMRVEQLACENDTWHTYCDEHSVFYHPNDECWYCDKKGVQKEMWSPWPRVEEHPIILSSYWSMPAKDEETRSVEPIRQTVGIVFCPNCGAGFQATWFSDKPFVSICQRCGKQFEVKK